MFALCLPSLSLSKLLPEKKRNSSRLCKETRITVAPEAGCLTWEWSCHVEDSSRFAIYELYTNREAFLEHKGSDHFAAWVEASTPCIKEKVAGQYDVVGKDPRVTLPAV